jgi:hypothetical protein
MIYISTQGRIHSFAANAKEEKLIYSKSIHDNELNLHNLQAVVANVNKANQFFK